jgi:hypothetical protein
MSSVAGQAGPSVKLSAIVVRACKCGHKREMGEPCEGCGTQTPPQVTDLGVIASRQQSWWERMKWNLWGFRAAQRRIRRVNKEACGQ